MSRKAGREVQSLARVSCWALSLEPRRELTSLRQPQRVQVRRRQPQYLQRQHL